MPQDFLDLVMRYGLADHSGRIICGNAWLLQCLSDSGNAPSQTKEIHLSLQVLFAKPLYKTGGHCEPGFAETALESTQVRTISGKGKARNVQLLQRLQLVLPQGIENSTRLRQGPKSQAPRLGI